MPHPIVHKSSYQQHKTLLERPHCAVLIGAITAEWTRVEYLLGFMFGAAFGEVVIEPDGSGKSVTHHWATLTTMQELESIRLRIKLIQKILVPLLPEPVKVAWEALEKELRARSKERNKVVHANWRLSNDWPDDLIDCTPEPTYIRYTERDFYDILDRITQLCIKTYDFAELVMAAQHEGKLLK